MIANSEVSKRYAKALFELVPQEKTESALKQLRSLAQVCQNPKIKDLIGSPVLSRKEKVLVVSQLVSNLSLEKEVETLALLLANKDRANIIDDVVKSFEAISDKKNKVLRGVVTSATELGSEEKKEIETAIEKFTGSQALLDYKNDEALIGGLIAKVGSFTFDGTLNTQLTKLKEDINRRIN